MGIGAAHRAPQRARAGGSARVGRPSLPTAYHPAHFARVLFARTGSALPRSLPRALCLLPLALLAQLLWEFEVLLEDREHLLTAFSMLVGLMAGELSQARLQGIELTNAALFWLLVSCVVGICISWAGFLCQSLVTATSYTVVGVMNKMLTVTARQPCRERIASAAPP